MGSRVNHIMSNSPENTIVISFLPEKTVCVAAIITQEIDLSLASGSAHLSVDSSNASSFSMGI